MLSWWPFVRTYVKYAKKNKKDVKKYSKNTEQETYLTQKQ